jgi:hypothetical protein
VLLRPRRILHRTRTPIHVRQGAVTLYEFCRWVPRRTRGEGPHLGSPSRCCGRAAADAPRRLPRGGYARWGPVGPRRLVAGRASRESGRLIQTTHARQ